MTRKIGHSISFGLNISIVFMEIIAAYISFGNNGLCMIQYYTDESNLFALVVCAICAYFALDCMIHNKDNPPRWVRIIKYMSVCYLMITFIVVMVILAPMVGPGGYRKMLLEDALIFHHLLCPVIAFTSFIFFERKPRIDKKITWIAMIPTIVYATIIIILNLLRVVDGPYPFLRIYKQSLFMSFVWLIIILGVAYLIGFGIRKLNNIKNN